MSNLGFDQFWAQAARQHQQPQGPDIVEIVRHVVSGVLAATSGAPQWTQNQNNAWGQASPFGQSYFGQGHYGQQQGHYGQQNDGQANFGQQQGFGQWPQQGGNDVENLVRAIIPAVLNGRAGQQQFTAGEPLNSFNNAKQGFGQQGFGQQGFDQLRQQPFNNGFGSIGQSGNDFGLNQSYGQQGFNGSQQQGVDLNNLLRAIVPAVLNAVTASQPLNNAQGWNQSQPWNNSQQWNNPQQGNYQQYGADRSNANNAFAQNQNAYDQQQQQSLRGVDLSLLIRAIAPDIAKAVVPVVLANLSGQQQQARHAG